MTEQDLALFQEYFQLQHQVNVNIVAGGEASTLPSIDVFEQMIPVPYKIASEMKGLEQNMLRPLRQLGDVVEPLAEYLKAQSRKIDLMMSYILKNEDDIGEQYHTKSYGGGGFIFESEQPFTLNHWYTCKLFFDEEATAVFCLAKLAAVETTELETTDENNSVITNTIYTNTMVFHRIREEDRESVVRASLHQQSKQLLKKTNAKLDKR